MTGDIAVEELKNYDDKLKLLYSYICKRMEIHEHKLHPNPSLYNEINGMSFYMETIKLRGYFRKDIKEELQYYGGDRIMVQNTKKILEYLKTYAKRVTNNTFTNFFEDKPNPGLYRIDFINGDIYSDYHESELQALISVKDEFKDMELKDPNEDVIKINSCKYYNVDRKNNQKHRCKFSKNNPPCALAHDAEKNLCPNLENLIRHEQDFFEQVINQISSVKEEAKNL